MPLILSNRGVNNFVDYFERNSGNSNISDLLNVVYYCLEDLIKFVFNLQFFVTIHSYLYFGPEGIRRNGTRSWNSLVSYSQPSTSTSTSDTIIRIEIDETTPLLSHSWKNYKNDSCSTDGFNKGKVVQFCEFRLMAIFFILISGFIIATYLLVVESRVPSLGFALDLVNHDIWSTVPLPHENLLNRSDVLHIVIKQTGGESCKISEVCIDILKKMQKLYLINNMTEEIPYNFLIGGDGQTYEVRGWDHESGISSLPQQSLLLIGFLGNFTNTLPSDVQLHSTLSLINESLRRKKIQKSYKIYGLRNLTISHQDGAALFKEISKWPRFDTLLHVL